FSIFSKKDTFMGSVLVDKIQPIRSFSYNIATQELT
ncbi:unnamed protein product, partial [marine sediment metagenome]